MDYGLRTRVEALGIWFMVYGLESRVYGLWCRV